MPKTDEQLKEIKESRISQIIGAGLKVFCEKGYDGASVDDVCKKAGVSHGLFYHYFENKKELFHEVMRRRRRIIHDDLVKELDILTSSREKLKKLINAFFDNIKNDENASYYFYLFVSGGFNQKEKRLPPPPKSQDMRPKKPFHLFFEDIFSEGQKNGEFKCDYSPKEYTKLLLSIIQGATLAYIITPKEHQITVSLPNVDMILDIFSKGEAL